MQDALCWIDIETTGLSPKEDRIIELFCQITDFSFQKLYCFHMWVTPVNMATLPEILQQMHSTSGLAADSELIHRDSFYDRIGLDQMDIDFSGHLQFARQSHSIENFYPAGASVHFDMSFLMALGLPLTMASLHHRHLDVSSLKLARLIETGVKPEFEAKYLPIHRANNDVWNSIEEARQLCLPMQETSLQAEHVLKVVTGNNEPS